LGKRSPSADIKKVEELPHRRAIAERLSRARYLAGPISMREFVSTKYNKRIYILGDFHHISTKCPPTANPANTTNPAEFIVNLIELVAPDTIDVWFEAQYLNKTVGEVKIQYAPSHLGNALNEFSPCLQVRKEKCPFLNARVHYTNIRSQSVVGRPEARAIGNIANLLHNFIEKAVDKREPSVSEAVDILAKNRWIFETKTADEFRTIVKINKQLANVADEKVKKALETQFGTVIAKNWLTTFDLNRIESALRAVDVYVLFELRDRIWALNAALMDMYLLARLFRRYRDKKTGAVVESGHKDVIYVGETHTWAYTKFLTQSLGFKKTREVADLQVDAKITKEAIAGLSQCLDISGFAPYFSSIPQ
jgi:hypothetical protein